MTHRRRWSYSLRTMFVVVTVLGCWLGYQLHWIRERAEVRSWLKSGPISPAGTFDFRNHPRPWGLRILGEKPESMLWIWVEPEESEQHYFARQDRIQRLFPEAHLVGFIPKSESGPDADE